MVTPQESTPKYLLPVRKEPNVHSLGNHLPRRGFHLATLKRATSFQRPILRWQAVLDGYPPPHTTGWSSPHLAYTISRSYRKRKMQYCKWILLPGNKLWWPQLQRILGRVMVDPEFCSNDLPEQWRPCLFWPDELFLVTSLKVLHPGIHKATNLKLRKTSIYTHRPSLLLSK